MSEIIDTVSEPVAPAEVLQTDQPAPARYYKTYKDLTPEQVEKRRAYLREYQRNNREKFRSAQQKYVANIANLKEFRARVYRESKTQHQIITCDCGSNVKYHSLKNHLRTKKHANYISANAA